MKIIFGFNDIRQDGMGTEAINLMRTLREQGIDVQPIHAWNKILIPGYVEEFHPIFIRDQEEEPLVEDVITDMVATINNDASCSIFSHFGSPNWACVIPYLRADIRIVVSVHSITPSALKIALAYHERVSAFVAISWGIRDRLLKALKKEYNKINLITNAIDTTLYSPSSNSNINRDCLKIIFFGRIEDYTKGCDKIPQIANILKTQGVKFEWDFYGYFHWGYENRFYKLNEKYGVSDVIKYRGCLNPSEVPEILSQYDLMVMPSNHEGFGLALAEAMAAGLCCVASHIPKVTDMILNSGTEGFLMGRNDITGFAKAIKTLCEDGSLRKLIGENAREKVCKQFSLQKQGLEYVQLFSRIMNSQDYHLIPNPTSLDEFKMPEIVKSHKLARILPVWLKRLLKRII